MSRNFQIGTKSDIINLGDLVKIGIDRRKWALTGVDTKEQTITITEYLYSEDISAGQTNDHEITVSFEGIREYGIKQWFKPPLNIYKIGHDNPNIAFKFRKGGS